MERKPELATKLRSSQQKKPLEIIHADLCGPTRTLALQGERYFTLFVDDYTRMMWYIS